MSQSILPSIGCLYTQFMVAIQEQVQRKQEIIQSFSSQNPLPRTLMEKESKKTIYLYELVLLLKALITLLKKVFEDFEAKDESDSLFETVLKIISDLKSLWEKEISDQVQNSAKELQNKTFVLLEEINRKEESIKKDIQERQKEIQELAQKVTQKAQDAIKT